MFVWLGSTATYIVCIVLSSQGKWHHYLLIPVQGLFTFFLAGNTRVIVKRTLWEAWQIKTFKALIAIGGVVYLLLSGYLYVFNVSYTNGRDIVLDGKINNVVILFSSLHFSYYLETYSRLTDIDGTTYLRTNYILVNADQDLETMLKYRQMQDD